MNDIILHLAGPVAGASLILVGAMWAEDFLDALGRRNDRRRARRAERASADMVVLFAPGSDGYKKYGPGYHR